MRRVRLSRTASNDLRREAAYLKQHAPAAAEAFLSRMEAAKERLGQFPESGPVQEPGDASGLRRLVVGDHVFTYRIGDDDVRVLFVRHGRQDRPAADDAR